MKNLFLTLIWVISLFTPSVSFAIQIYTVTPKNIEEIKAEITSTPSSKSVCRVTHADLIDWESLQPENYELIYARISDDFFLSQFSLKHGFRLEPFFPLLFPNSRETVKNAAAELKKDLNEIKWEINNTLYEIHAEFFLLPLTTWCSGKQIRLEYVIQTESYVPVRFLIEDALLLRRACTEEKSAFSSALAESIARQNGILSLNDVPVPYSTNRSVLLLTDRTLCREVKEFKEGVDYLTEVQLSYATVTHKATGPEAGFGAATWKEITLAFPRDQYTPETEKFLLRFQKAGGIINTQK